MSDDLNVRFGADTAGLEAGVDRSKDKIGEVADPVKTLEALLDDLKSTVEKAFSPGGDGLKNSADEAVSAIELMRGVIEGMEGELKTAFDGADPSKVVGASEEAKTALAEVNRMIAEGKAVTAEAIQQLGGLANFEKMVADNARDQAAALRGGSDALDAMMSKIKAETSAWSENKEEREALLRTMSQQAQLERQGIELTEEQTRALHELNRAYVQQRAATEQAERAERNANRERERTKGGIGGLVGAVRGQLMALAGTMLAAFSVDAVINWARRTGEAAQHIQELADRLGLAVEEVQQLSAMADLSGTNIDKLATGVARLDVAFAQARSGSKAQSLAFKELGIDTSASYTQMELLRLTMERFQELPAGPQKTALAIRVMGQAGAELIPFLNRGAEGFDALNEKIERYNLLSPEAQAAGVAMGEAFAENKLAVQGLSNVFAETLGPVIADIIDGVNDLIASFVKSYKEGGVVKGFMEGFATVLRWVTVVIVGLYNAGDQAFSRLWGLIQMFVGHARAKFVEFKLSVDTLGNAFVDLGLVMLRSLVGPWPQIQKAMDDNLADLRRKVAAARSEIASIQFDTAQASGATFAGADARLRAADDWAVGFLNPTGDKPAASPTGGLGNTSGMSGASSAGGGQDIVSKWREELRRLQVASGEFFKDQTRAELEFWEAKLAATKKASKAWYDVQELIFEARKKLAREAYEEELAVLDEAIGVAEQNNAEQARLMDEKVAKVRATFGEESKEYRAALREQRTLAREHQEELLRLTLDGIQHRRELAVIEAEAERTEAESRAQVEEVYRDENERMGRIHAATAAMQRAAARQREYEEERRHLERLFQLRLQALVDEAAANRAAGRFEEEARINREIEKLRADHYANLRELAAQNATRLAADMSQVAQAVENSWRGVFEPIGNGFGAMVNNMVTGARSFGEIWNNIGLQMLNNITNWLAQTVTEWLAAEMAKTGITIWGESTRTGVKVGAAAVDSGIELAKVGVTVGAEAAKTGAVAVGVSTRTGIEVAGAATSKAVTLGTALAEVGAQAVRAAAGAYAAIAGIPVIGPFLAPVMAGIALASVLALGRQIFSAEGGWGEVPHDGAQTVLHKKEMVLPASIAQPLRAAIATGQIGGNAASNARAPRALPPIHISALDAKSVERLFRQRGGALVRALEEQYRSFAMAEGV